MTTVGERSGFEMVLDLGSSMSGKGGRRKLVVVVLSQFVG